MATGRVQIDLGSRASVAASGLFRNESDLEARRGSAGVALGFAPGVEADDVDADRRPVPRRGVGHVLCLHQRDIARGLPGHLGHLHAAGTLRRRRRRSRHRAVWLRHDLPAADAFQRQSLVLQRQQPHQRHHHAHLPGAAALVPLGTLLKRAVHDNSQLPTSNSQLPSPSAIGGILWELGVGGWELEIGS